MLMADFTTAVKEKLPIKVILFNDGKLKNIDKEQGNAGYPIFGTTLHNPDFANFARSCGGDGFRVEDSKKLDKAIKKALESDKPAIVDVVVDPEKLEPITR